MIFSGNTPHFHYFVFIFSGKSFRSKKFSGFPSQCGVDSRGFLISVVSHTQDLGMAGSFSGCFLLQNNSKPPGIPLPPLCSRKYPYFGSFGPHLGHRGPRAAPQQLAPLHSSQTPTFGRRIPLERLVRAVVGRTEASVTSRTATVQYMYLRPVAFQRCPSRPTCGLAWGTNLFIHKILSPVVGTH